jgi:tripartite-type tricarboxylate transporter receptor subunit TctC
MAGELFKMMSGVDIVHVPYRGEGAAQTDLLSGRAHVMFGVMALSIEHIRGGRLRALAVTTAARQQALPDVPTVGEFLPGYDVSGSGGLAAPRNTPVEIIETLNTQLNAVLAEPQTRARFVELGGMVLPGTPAAFGKLVADENEKWIKVIKFAGIKAG